MTLAQKIFFADWSLEEIVAYYQADNQTKREMLLDKQKQGLKPEVI